MALSLVKTRVQQTQWNVLVYSSMQRCTEQMFFRWFDKWYINVRILWRDYFKIELPFSDVC